MERKSFSAPDEVRDFSKGKVENLTFGKGVVGRFTMKPGWKWSSDIKPVVGTDLCQVPHFAYQLSGRMRVRMEDGSEFETGPDEVAIIPPGHDAWVVGDEDLVLFDWTGTTSDYARPQ